MEQQQRHRWLLRLCAVYALASLPRVLSQETYFGTIQIVAIHGKWHGTDPPEHLHQYQLLTKTGDHKQLLFPKEPGRLPMTGTPIMVKTVPMGECDKKLAQTNTTALCVGTLVAHEAAPRDSFAYGQPRGPVRMKALVMQLRVCDQGPATTYDDLMQTMWSDVPNARDETVQSMFEACSYKLANISRRLGGTVLKVTVPVPCSGTTPQGQAYNGWECPFNEFSDMANEYVQKTLKIKLSDYKYKIYIVPKGNLCSWGGMGYVGCVDDCRSWISGDLVNDPAAYMHELGHNLYLNHAGKQGDNGYGDLSCTMGFCCDVRCYNAPHAHQLGWARPMGTLHKDNFPSGWWWSYRIPAAIVKRDNFLRIRPDWTARGAGFNIFVGYRKTLGYDSGLNLDSGFGNRVQVYSTPLGVAQPYTSWEMSIDRGQLWREARLDSRLVIRVFGYEGNNAVVGVCRTEGPRETNCGDGKDNDCDTLTDKDDPDCKNGVTRRLMSLFSR